MKTSLVIHTAHKQHSNNTKVKAVRLWLQLGNLVKVAERLKISYDVVKHWRYKTDWWDKIAQEIRSEHEQYKDGKIEQLVHKSFEALGDRLENGDHILDSRSGEVRRVPMKGKDLANVAKSLHQQQKEIRDTPIQAAAQQATKEILVDLAKQFAQLAKPKEKVIEGEVVADSRDD